MPAAEMFETKVILNPTQQMSAPIVVVGIIPCTWNLEYGFVFGPCAGDFTFVECSCSLGEGEAKEGECWGRLLGHCVLRFVGMIKDLPVEVSGIGERMSRKLEEFR